MSGRSLSTDLRAHCDGIWTRLHEHPFLRELARAELPLDKFRFFLEQDVLYLPDYARCMAIGAAKSATEAELRFFAAELDGTMNLELPNQRRVLDQVRELGARDQGGAIGKAPATVAYTNFMLAVSARGTPLEIMAAILPCAWSYVEIAARLAGEIADHPVYRDWVSFYLTEEVRELVDRMRTGFDELASEEAMGSRRGERLREIFATSSRLEEAFWQMAYTLDQWPDLRRARSREAEPRGTEMTGAAGCLGRDELP
jgi:thiaminase/transcriptional activator TenA